MPKLSFNPNLEMSMNKMILQPSSSGQSAFDATASLLLVCHASAEKMSELNLAMLREAVEDAARVSHMLIEAKDLPTVLFNLGALAQPGIERIADYCRAAHAIARQAQGEMAQAIGQTA